MTQAGRHARGLHWTISTCRGPTQPSSGRTLSFWMALKVSLPSMSTEGCSYWLRSSYRASVNHLRLLPLHRRCRRCCCGASLMLAAGREEPTQRSSVIN